MQSSGSTYKHNIGFTLLEVMLVLLLMGLAAGYVMFNAFGASKSDLLKSQAQRPVSYTHLTLPTNREV